MQSLPSPPLLQLYHLQSGLLSHGSVKPGAMQLVSDLASAFHGSRVSLGLARRRRVALVAASDGGEDRYRGETATSVEAAMEEAMDQDSTVMLPERPGGRSLVSVAHALLLGRNCAVVVSAPLRDGGRTIGVVTLEWRSEEDAKSFDLVQFGHQLALIAPVLSLMLRADMPVHERLASHLSHAWRGTPSLRRWAWGTACAAAALVLAIPISQPLAGTARVEGEVERGVTAPADGFLQAVHVRPGDSVSAGTPLLELAASDLQVESQRAAGEVAQHESAYLVALSRSDRGQMAIHLARLQEAQAQLQLSQGRLARARIDAPITGMVIDGDLTRSIGAPVKRGERLLTIAPREERRVIIQVDERDIGQVKAGQAASLALSALPWSRLPLRVTHVNPVARPVDGANVFEVEAVPAGTTAQLRPGMTGVARIEAGAEPLMAAVSGRLLGALRLRWWLWGL